MELHTCRREALLPSVELFQVSSRILPRSGAIQLSRAELMIEAVQEDVLGVNALPEKP